MRIRRPRNVPAAWPVLLLGLASHLPAQVVRMSAAAGSSVTLAAPPLRMAISDTVVTGVSLNDAKAAMSIWTRELLKSVSLKPDPQEQWVMPSEELLQAIRAGRLDLFCVTVQEYRRVHPYVDTSRIIVDDTEGETLLLVVRESSGITSLAGLRGRSLIVWDNPRTVLAEPWLTMALAQQGLESPKQLLSRVTTNAKLPQVILPLYFGQADACLVTRPGLDTMSELNPQLSRKLKVLLQSPRMTTAFLAFRKDYPEHLKKPIFDRFLVLKSIPATEQVLTLFQTSGFVARDSECLSSANSLLDAYERGRAPGSGKTR